MAEGVEGSVQQHALARVAHHVLYAGTHVGFVAMGGTFGAGSLLLLIGTAGETLVGIAGQFGAVAAQSFGAMVCLAIEGNHLCDHSLLVFDHTHAPFG